jgi:hypothetical protein
LRSRRWYFAGTLDAPFHFCLLSSSACSASIYFISESAKFIVSQASHWSCCGALRLEAPCTLIGGSQTAVQADTDEVTSSELDALMQARLPCPPVFQTTFPQT